jgi:hypothetical protein
MPGYPGVESERNRLKSAAALRGYMSSKWMFDGLSGSD